MKKIIPLILTLMLCFSISPTAFAANPFGDVTETDYYYDAVMWAKENGITGGVTATRFEPTSTCTRGQVVTFLWRANGQPEPSTQINPFKDINESNYFYKAVLWAVEKGITGGVSADTFAPYQHCTRAHTLTFLWRAEGKPGVSGESVWANQYEGKYYYEAMKWAEYNGMIRGSVFEFDPGNACPRADIVNYMYKALAGTSVGKETPPTNVVENKPAEITSIVFEQQTYEIYAGVPTKLNVKIYPENAIDTSLTWTVKWDGYKVEDWLSVTNEGIITGRSDTYDLSIDKCPTVTCTAANGISASCQVKIKNTMYITSAEKNKDISSLSLYAGEKYELGVRFEEGYTGSRNVTWEIDDKPFDASVASLSKDGTLKAYRPNGGFFVRATTDSGASELLWVMIRKLEDPIVIVENSLPDTVLDNNGYKIMITDVKTETYYSTFTNDYFYTELIFSVEKGPNIIGGYTDKETTSWLAYKIRDAEGYTVDTGNLYISNWVCGEKVKETVAFYAPAKQIYYMEVIGEG